MKTKVIVAILVVTLLTTMGLTTAFASDGYSGYLKFISTTYYYLLATDYATGYPLSGRNVCTTHSVPNNSNWKCRCTCCNNSISRDFWHGLGDYTYAYEDYEHELSGEKLIARPNSDVTGVTVGGTFWGRK